MELARNGRTFIESWFDAVWNHGRGDVIDETVPPDSVAHGLIDADKVARGPDGVRAFWMMFRHGFSDIRMDIQEVLTGDGDPATSGSSGTPGSAGTPGSRREVCRWLATGVHTGAFGGVMPTGRTVRIVGTTWMHVHDGKIRESFTNWDQQGLLDQLARAR